VVAEKHRVTVNSLCCQHERQRRRPNGFEMEESKIKAKKETKPSLSRSGKNKFLSCSMKKGAIFKSSFHRYVHELPTR